jgi:hypothetical protein
MKTYDWEAVERDYRLGRFSLRELTTKHGPSEGAVRARAKKHGWAQDLSDKIRAEVRRKVSTRIDPKAQADIKAAREASDADIVDQASEVVADIVRDHQLILTRSRLQVATLMGKVDSLLHWEKPDDADADDTGPDALYVSRVMTNNVSALERIIKMERVAFGVEDDQGQVAGRNLAELLRDVQPEETEKS